jgi:hypothetical protein
MSPDQPSSQKARIAWKLHAAYPNWVPAPSLAAVSLQYSARIFELRREGWQIDNKVEVQPDGTKHGFFRLAQPMTYPNPSDKRELRPAIDVPTRSAPPASLFGDLSIQHRDDG